MFFSNIFKDLEGQEALILAEEVTKDSHHVELQQAPELRIERLVKKALVLLGSLQGLYGLYGFDAEVSPFLQWSRVIASVSHRHYQFQSFGSRELQR